MHVYVYVYIHTYINTYTHTRLYGSGSIRFNPSTPWQKELVMRGHIHTYRHTYTPHTYTHTYTQLYGSGSIRFNPSTPWQKELVMRGHLRDVNQQLRDMQYISGENVNVKLAGSDAIEYRFFDYGYGGVLCVCVYM